MASKLDEHWLQDVQRKLYQRGQHDLDYVFRKLWGLVTDHRNLRNALMRVSHNRGRRTAGVNGVTVGKLLQAQGVDAFVEALRVELRSGRFKPVPVRRVKIPKPGQPGKFRPLGIPTVKDRVVQAALKNILEPIFEADFFPISYGFRPGRSAHGALEQLKITLCPRVDRLGPQPRLRYPWAIEGDIKGCFDNISHHGLLQRVRRRVLDPKVNRLIVAFLKAGVLSEGQFTRTENGTPQGGILSPLLANIALSVIEERYERYVWPRRCRTGRTDPTAIGHRAANNRRRDHAKGQVTFYPIRYADDFIILVGAPQGPEQQASARKAATQERDALARFLKEHLSLELSESKTLITPVTQPLRFLGHHVRVRRHPRHRRWVSSTLIPKDRSQRIREKIKALFRHQTTGHSLAERILQLNPVTRGWAYFYRHAWGAKRVFCSLDHYVWWTIWRWLKAKHPRVRRRELAQRYGFRQPGRRTIHWHDQGQHPFLMSKVRVRRYLLGWQRRPAFVSEVYGEPGA